MSLLEKKRVNRMRIMKMIPNDHDYSVMTMIYEIMKRYKHDHDY